MYNVHPYRVKGNDAGACALESIDSGIKVVLKVIVSPALPHCPIKNPSLLIPDLMKTK